MEKNIIKKITEKAVASVMSSGPYEWPPSCIVFAYQPMRPKRKNAKCNDTKFPKKEDHN